MSLYVIGSICSLILGYITYLYVRSLAIKRKKKLYEDIILHINEAVEHGTLTFRETKCIEKAILAAKTHITDKASRYNKLDLTVACLLDFTEK